MTDTDLDIILAIADGRLTGQAKRDALTRIAADPELGEALASQIATMDELKSLEPALMTPSERAALRSALVEQLNLQPAAPVVELATHRRRMWRPILGLASAAALLLAIVVIPSMFSGGDDSSADLAAIAPEATTTADTATAFDAGTAESSEAAPPTSLIVVPRIAGEDVQEFFATSPPLPDNTPKATTDGSTGAGDTDGADGVIGSSTITLSTGPVAEGAGVDIDSSTVDACLEDLGDALPGGDLVLVAATLDNGQTVIHFGIDTDGQVAYAVSVVLNTCTIAP